MEAHRWFLSVLPTMRAVSLRLKPEGEPWSRVLRSANSETGGFNLPEESQTLPLSSQSNLQAPFNSREMLKDGVCVRNWGAGQSPFAFSLPVSGEGAKMIDYGAELAGHDFKARLSYEAQLQEYSDLRKSDAGMPSESHACHFTSPATDVDAHLDNLGSHCSVGTGPQHKVRVLRNLHDSEQASRRARSLFVVSPFQTNTGLNAPSKRTVFGRIHLQHLLECTCRSARLNVGPAPQHSPGAKGEAVRACPTVAPATMLTSRAPPPNDMPPDTQNSIHLRTARPASASLHLPLHPAGQPSNDNGFVSNLKLHYCPLSCCRAQRPRLSFEAFVGGNKTPHRIISPLLQGCGAATSCRCYCS